MKHYQNVTTLEDDLLGNIRAVVGEDGKPLFVGVDLARGFGYPNPQQALDRYVDEHDKVQAQLCAPDGSHTPVTMVDESAFYALALDSPLPECKRYRHWVTSVVMTHVANRGAYVDVDLADSESNLVDNALAALNSAIAFRRRLFGEEAGWDA